MAENKQPPQASKLENIRRQLFCGLIAGSDEQTQEASERESPSKSRKSIFRLSLKSNKLSSSNSESNKQSSSKESLRTNGQDSSCEHLVKMISDKNLAIEERSQRPGSDKPNQCHSSELLILLGSQRQLQGRTTSGLPERKYSTGSEPTCLPAEKRSPHSSRRVPAQTRARPTDASPTGRSYSEPLVELLEELNSRRALLLAGAHSIQLEESWSEFVDLSGWSGSELGPRKALSSDSESFSRSPGRSQAGGNLKVQQDAIWELCVTEANYLKRLRVLVELFLSSLLELQRRGFLLELEPSKLSSNICEIYEANLSLWQEHLEPMVARSRSQRSPLEPRMLTSAFLEIRNTFHPYYKYCSEHSACLSYVRQSARSNEHFRTYLAWCESQKECERLRLTDLLAKPVQRLTRYSLLLKAIAKRTYGEEQLRALELMITFVNKFVLTVDLELRRKEELERLVKVSHSIDAYELSLNGAEMYGEEPDRLARMNHCHFDLTRPLFNCPFECPRELLFDSRACFIHQPKVSPSPRLEGVSNWLHNNEPTGALHQNHLEGSNCGSLPLPGAHWGSPARTSGVPCSPSSCLTLGQIKFKDLQMSSGKPVEVVLLVFTDQLFVCRPSTNNRARWQRELTTAGAASSRQPSSHNKKRPTASLAPSSAENGPETRLAEQSSGATSASANASDCGEHSPGSRKRLGMGAGQSGGGCVCGAGQKQTTGASKLLQQSPIGNTRYLAGWQSAAAPCHSSSSSVWPPQQAQPSVAAGAGSGRQHFEWNLSEPADNSCLHNGQQLGSPQRRDQGKAAAAASRSLSFSNVMLNLHSAAELFHKPSAATSASAAAAAFTLSSSSSGSSGLRVIRSPYPIERLLMYELRDGQSVFCCQLNDSLTIATSFILYTSCPSGELISRGLGGGGKSGAEQQQSCESSAGAREQNCNQADEPPDTFNGTIRQLFNNFAGSSSSEGRRKQVTPAGQLILLIRQAQARLHIAANFHGRQALNLSQSGSFGGRARVDQDNPGRDLDSLSRLAAGKQSNGRALKLSAWPSFRSKSSGREKSAELAQNILPNKPSDNNNNKEDQQPCRKRRDANDAATNHHELSPSDSQILQQASECAGSVSGRGISKESSNASERAAAKTHQADPIMSAVAEQHQSMLLAHGLHRQLAAYNYNYRLLEADYNRVLAEPVSLMRKPSWMSCSSLSQSMATAAASVSPAASRQDCCLARRISSNEQLLLPYQQQPYAHNQLVAANYNLSASQTGSQNSVFEESHGESLEECNSTWASNHQKQLLLSPHRCQEGQLRVTGSRGCLQRGSLDSSSRRESMSCPQSSGRQRTFSRSARLLNNQEASFENEHASLFIACPPQAALSRRQQHSLTSSSSSARSSPQAILLARPDCRKQPEQPAGSHRASSSYSASNVCVEGSLSSDEMGSLSAGTASTAPAELIDRLLTGGPGSGAARRPGSGRRNLSSLKRQNVVMSASSDHQMSNQLKFAHSANSNCNSSLEHSCLSSASGNGSAPRQREGSPERRPEQRGQLANCSRQPEGSSSQATTMDQLSITFDDCDNEQLCPLHHLADSTSGPAEQAQREAVKATSFELGTLRGHSAGPQPSTGAGRSSECACSSSHWLSTCAPAVQLRSASVEARSPIAVTLTRPLSDNQEPQLAAASPPGQSEQPAPGRAQSSRKSAARRQQISYLNIPQSSQANCARQTRSFSSNDSYFQPPRQRAGSSSIGSLSPIESNASTPLQVESCRTVIGREPEPSTSSLSSLSPVRGSFRERSLERLHQAPLCPNECLSRRMLSLLFEARPAKLVEAKHNASRSFEHVNSSSSAPTANRHHLSANKLRVALSEAATMDLADEYDTDAGRATLSDVKCIDSLLREPLAMANGHFQAAHSDHEEPSGRAYLGFHEKLSLHNKRVAEERERRLKKSSRLSQPFAEQAYPDLLLQELPVDDSRNLRSAFSQLTHKSALNLKRAFLSRSPTRKGSSPSNPTNLMAISSSKANTLELSDKHQHKRAQKSASLIRFDSLLHKATSLRSITSQHSSNR